MANIIGQRLRAAVRASGKSQNRVSKELGMPNESYLRYIFNKEDKNQKLNDIKRVCYVAQVSVEEIIDGVF